MWLKFRQCDSMNTRSYHEDNAVKPSKPHCKFLKGRVLSGSSSQSFDTAWIFQRFVNLTMQLVVRFTEFEGSWYQTDVEVGKIVFDCNPSIVNIGFSILSPLLFPLVYGVAVIALIIFAPISIPYIFKVKAGGAKSMDVFVTMCKSAWYFAAGVFSWFYVFWPTSTLNCAIDFTCKDVPYHIAPALVYSMFSSFMIAGFRYTREISSSACDCACERHKKLLMGDLMYGSALTSIVDKLSDKRDKLSYYPIFVKTEDDEVVLRLSWTTEAALIACAGVHALLPVAWMARWYHQPFLSLSVDYMTAGMLFFGTVMPFVEVRHLLQQFLLSLEEFQQCTDQLLIVLYIASPDAVKATLKHAFKEAVAKNDEYRMQHHKSDEDAKYVALMEGEERFKEIGKDDVYDSANSYVLDELYNMKEFQVAFNFRRVEGLSLYRLMCRYLRIDILNERFEVEQFTNLSIVILFVGVLVLLVLYLQEKGLTCMWILIPYDVAVLFVFLMRTLNLYSKADRYLVTEHMKVLECWRLHCVQWDFPESEFEFLGCEQAHSFSSGMMGITCDDDGYVQDVSDDGQAYLKGIQRGHRCVKIGSQLFSKDLLKSAENSGNEYKITVRESESARRPAIAWIWNTLTGQPEPVKFLDEKSWEQRDTTYGQEIYESLEQMLQACSMDVKQRLLDLNYFLNIARELHIVLVWTYRIVFYSVLAYTVMAVKSLSSMAFWSLLETIKAWEERYGICAWIEEAVEMSPWRVCLLILLIYGTPLLWFYLSSTNRP